MASKIPKEFKSWSYQFKKELMIALVIMISPFLIYLHLVFSTSSGAFEVLFIEWKHGFKNNQLFAWNLLSDLIPLSLLILTYASIQNAYKHFIIPFIVLFLCFTTSDVFYLNPIYYIISVEGIYFAFVTVILLRFADRFLINKFRRKSLTLSYNELISELLVLSNSKIIKNVEKTARQSRQVTTMQYVCRLHYYSELMQKAINKSIINFNEGIRSTKPESNKLLIKVTFIVALLLNFVYLIFPKDLKSFELIGINFHDLGFGTINNLVWYLLKKVSLLIVFFIWYSTSINWWRIAILSPILIYAYQIIEVFYDVKDIESYGNSNVFPAVFLILIVILLISRIIKLRTKMMDYLEMFQSELNRAIGELSKSV